MITKYIKIICIAFIFIMLTTFGALMFIEYDNYKKRENIIEKSSELQELLEISRKIDYDLKQANIENRKLIEKERQEFWREILEAEEVSKEYVDIKNLIKKQEGFKLEAYQDIGGKWTICWGHTATAKQGQILTKEQCEILLHKDIIAKIKHFENESIYKKNQNVFNQLPACYNFYIDMVYNNGIEGLKYKKNSKKQTDFFQEAINNPCGEKAFNLAKTFNKVKGMEIKGLTKRREITIHLAKQEKAKFKPKTLNDIFLIID